MGINTGIIMKKNPFNIRNQEVASFAAKPLSK